MIGIRRLARHYLRRIWKIRDARTLAALKRDESEPTSKFVRAVDMYQSGFGPEEEQRIAEIEHLRSAMLADDSPLIDPELGLTGPYDKGQTVAMACRVSKPPASARMLYALVRAYRPRLILELGTNVGISSSYLASAQQFNGDSGRLITCEASRNRVRHARRNHRSLGLTNTEVVEGLFSDTLDSVLESCGEIDFAFIDGHHQFQSTLDYFDNIYNHSSLSAMFVFDDIRWSEGMTRAWNEIVTHRRLDVCFDLTRWGLGVRDPLHLSRPGAPRLRALAV